MKAGTAKTLRKRTVDAARWVTTGQFAKVAGVSDQAVRDAIRSGRISAVTRGQWYRINLDTELQRFRSTMVRRHLNARAAAEDEDPTSVDSEDGITEINAAQRERMYKARKAKLDYLQRKDELIPAATVLREWQNVAQGVQARLLSIPDRVSTMVEGMKHRDIHKVLTDEIRNALTDVSDSIRPAV